jgi:hypothetical protein
MDEQRDGEAGSRLRYHLKRRFWFVWAWTVERDGVAMASGWAFSRLSARWSARNVMRGRRRISKPTRADDPAVKVVKGKRVA